MVLDVRYTCRCCIFLITAALILPNNNIVDGSEHHEESYSSGYHLTKVIVLSRHGNRIPNIDILDACPEYTSTFHSFDGAEGQLTGVGMRELYQFGRWLRHRYAEERDFIPHMYSDDNTVTFESEEAPRNIMSMTALAQGLFISGEGPKGYLPSRPQPVPIHTAWPGHDDLFNSPRDGICRDKASEDRERISAEREKHLSDHDKHLFATIGKSCMGLHRPATIKELKDTEASLCDWLKSVDDAFLFAEREGFDSKLHDFISSHHLHEFHKMAFSWMNKDFFGTPSQVIQWAGQFPERLLQEIDSSLSHKTIQDHTEKDILKSKEHRAAPLMSIFLNHRELLYAVNAFFDINIAIGGYPQHYLPSGTSMVWEIRENDKKEKRIKAFVWWPSTQKDPSMSAKGHYYQTNPIACEGETNGSGCPLSIWKKIYTTMTKKNGTYKDICLPKGGTSPLAPTHASATEKKKDVKSKK